MRDTEVKVREIPRLSTHADTTIEVSFTEDAISSGSSSSISYSNPVARLCLHRLFGVREGEVLTRVEISKDGIRGYFKTGQYSQVDSLAYLRSGM